MALRHPRKSGPTTTSVPSELYHQAARRVELAGWVFFAVWGLFLVATIFTMDYSPAWFRATGWYRWQYYVLPLGVVTSLLAILLARRCEGDARQVIRLGLGFMIANAALIAFPNQWGSTSHLGPGVSWVVPVVLLFPAIVPVTPRQMLIAGGFACSLDPLFHLVAQSVGAAPILGAADWFWMILPNAVGAAMSMVPARVVRGLGRAVAEAREVGNYRLGDLLGKGGMGEVYVASHRLLARPAAVKVIAPAHLGARDVVGQLEVAERFRREASAAANLRSPHTIELYDFGTAADGTLFYAMELLDGLTLQSLVDRFGPVSPGRVIQILRQVCLSLAEAHGKGLVHRDVKPSNLMICRMGTEVDFVKVLDFGLVKATTQMGKALTGEDIAAGTPAFMAPEAIDGVHGLDHRADLYAVGCVAYWLLAGRPVFDGNTALAVLVKHGREVPPPLTGTAGPVEPDLSALMFQCLEKDPARRPADALALEAALSACRQASAWTRADSRAWWESNLTPAQKASDARPSLGATLSPIRASNS